MIKSFKHKGLELFFYTGSKNGIIPEHSKKLGKILDRLHAATELRDLRWPGSNFHHLTGNFKGMYSISVSGNWRIIFKFENGQIYDIDYLAPYSSITVKKNKKLGWCTWVAGFPRWTTIKEKKMKIIKRKPTHPGQILKEDYLEPLDLTLLPIYQKVMVVLARLYQK